MKPTWNTGVLKAAREWFEANPGCQIEISELMRKFNAGNGTLRNVIWRLKAEGVIKRRVVYMLEDDPK